MVPPVRPVPAVMEVTVPPPPFGRFVSAEPSTAGSLPLPSSCTILSAVVPTSTAMVPVVVMVPPVRPVPAVMDDTVPPPGRFVSAEPSPTKAVAVAVPSTSSEVKVPAPGVVAPIMLPSIAPPLISTASELCSAIFPSSREVRAVAPFSKTHLVPSLTINLPSVWVNPAMVVKSESNCVLKLYGEDVSCTRGVSSGSVPTVTPSQYCLSNGILRGLSLPNITLKIPLLTRTPFCVSSQS